MKNITITKQTLHILLCMSTGLLSIQVDASFAVQANAVAVDNNMNILAAGLSQNFTNGHGSGYIARYLPLGGTDTSFGTNGVTITTQGDSTSFDAIGFQSTNKIVVAGQVIISSVPKAALFRYTTAGALDASFGNSGIAIVPSFTGAGGSGFMAAKVQSDDKIVAAGGASIAGKPFTLLARFNSNGTLDNSFGGNGVIIITIGAASAVNGLAIQPNGYIVTGGISQSAAPSQLAIARFTPTGSIDNLFGTNGITLTTIPNASFSRIYGITLQGDGSIIVAGTASFDDGSQVFVIARYTSGGILDTTFNGTGIVQTSIDFASTAFSVLVQDDGQIVAAGFTSGNTNGSFAAVRYNTDGTLDTTFGTNGITTIQLNPDGQGDFAYAIAPQLGTTFQDQFIIVDRGLILAGASDINFGLIRLKQSDGTLDTNFGTAGIVTVPQGSL